MIAAAAPLVLLLLFSLFSDECNRDSHSEGSSQLASFAEYTDFPSVWVIDFVRSIEIQGIMFVVTWR